MSPLGAGANGEVHLAWDRTDGRWVALKRFTGQDELGLLRMVIESRIRVSHPHLVRTLAFRLVDDRAWLVTELARGGSLRGLIARTGRLPWGWVVEAVDQILSALVALHATGVVHRDLKPANLLLRSHGPTHPHLLVGDFGIATWRTVSMTGIGAAIGTPGYLAPEYLDGQSPSPATDLFAVGVLAAELLAGHRLVHYSNAAPTIPSSWHDVVPVPPEVPPPVAAVLQRMASPDPTHRYRDCTDAREALVQVAPPHLRGDLTTVPVPDLLAALPPAWTEDGPALPTPAAPAEGAPADRTETLSPPADGSPASEPNLVGLPIDGGPTGLVLEHQATIVPVAHSGSSTEPPTGSATQPVSGSATPPSGYVTSPATPPNGSAAPSSPATPPGGTDTKAAQRRAREARRGRKARQAALLVVVVILAAGAGTLWWAATHRAIPGQGTAAVGGGQGQPDQPAGHWEPTVVGPCDAVEIGQERSGAGGTERCQYTPATPGQRQNWVEEPPGGFPKSDPGGPFPNEKCGNDGDRRYSPVGDHLRCTHGTWQVIA